MSMYGIRDRYVCAFCRKVRVQPKEQVHFQHKFSDGTEGNFILSDKLLTIWNSKHWVPLKDWYATEDSHGRYFLWVAHHEMIKARDSLKY